MIKIEIDESKAICPICQKSGPKKFVLIDKTGWYWRCIRCDATFRHYHEGQEGMQNL